MLAFRPVKAVSQRAAAAAAASRARGMFGGQVPPGGRVPFSGFWVTPPAVVPCFREGQDKIDTSKFTIDCSPYKAQPEPEAELQERMEAVFKEMGVVRLTNTGLTEASDMKTYANVVLKEQMKYEGGANPREGIVKNVYEVGAPTDAWLHYHHEMAYNQHSMKNLAFASVKAPWGKGDTYLSENLSVTEELLKTDLGRKLQDKGVCYIRCLTDREAYKGQGWKEGKAVYNHWQLSFGAETTQDAEEKAHACGLETEWCTDPLMEDSKRYLKTKLRADAFEFCPDVGKNVLFSSIADHNMWFDTWQGVSDVPPEKRPLQLTFGDGSEITVEELRQWVRLYDRSGIRVRWQTGDIVAFCNYRFAHGRPAFELRPWEERQIGVMLGEKFWREGARPDAW